MVSKNLKGVEIEFLHFVYFMLENDPDPHVKVSAIWIFLALLSDEKTYKNDFSGPLKEIEKNLVDCLM